MSSFLPMNRYYKQYSKFYLNVVLKFSHYFYNYCYWVDKLATIIMILLILGDLVFNNMVLNSSLWFAPMYSMFKFIFVITKFVETKQDLIMDYYLIHSSYVGRGYVFPDDDSFYGLTWQSRFPEMCKYEKEVIKV
jgi:hypothetical protein